MRESLRNGVLKERRFFKEQLPEYDPFKHNIQSAIIDGLQVHISMAAKVYDAWYCQVEQMMSRC
jgi:hypothetical protein